MNEMQHSKIQDMVYIGIFATVIALCSWISIPAAVPFTLQTLGIFLALGVLGGKRGTLAILTYILLGSIGVPVFSGFSGGIGALFGTTGGYILGFLFSGLLVWGMENVFGRGKKIQIFSMLVGLLVCYAFGTAWFMVVYMKNTGAIALGTVLGWCVFPFVIPDCIKLATALFVAERLKKAMSFL